MTEQEPQDTEAPPGAAPSRLKRVLFGVGLLAALGLVVSYYLRRDQSIWEILASTRLEVVAAGVGSYWIYMFLRTLRMKILLGEYAPPLRSLFYIQCTSGALGALTPGRIAEAVKIGQLCKGHDVPLEKAMVAFAVEKTQDLAWYGIAALGTVWVLGNLDFLQEGWLRDWFLPVMATLLVAAAAALLFYAWRSASQLSHVGAVLLLGAVVFVGTFMTCFVVVLLHGITSPGQTLAVYSLTVIAGALSGLPGGGQGVVQYAFHFSAQHVFGAEQETIVSLVHHITVNFYLGVSSSCLLAWVLRPRSGS